MSACDQSADRGLENGGWKGAPQVSGHGLGRLEKFERERGVNRDFCLEIGDFGMEIKSKMCHHSRARGPQLRAAGAAAGGREIVAELAQPHRS